MGVEFSAKCVKVNNSIIKAQIWDTGIFLCGTVVIYSGAGAIPLYYECVWTFGFV